MLIRNIAFDPVDPPARIVERRQDDRRAELALIDQILRTPVIRVDAEREPPDLLFGTNVEIVLPLGKGHGGERGVDAIVTGCLRAGKTVFQHAGGGDVRERRRREIARVAGMEREPL
ncbi:hypothetical protein D9M73_214330 [compost metagenome]